MTRPIFTLYAAIALLLMSCSASAGDPPKEPILRIETGMHTAMIGRIGMNAQNRYLATGSYDKTVRIWELSTGKLLNILRPPIGQGDEGKIYSVVMSPDGNTVAFGGWTGWDWEGKAYIYLFDCSSGTMTRRIKNLSHRIANLAYSRDGRFLSATLKEGGVRVFRASDGTLTGEDKEYGTDSYCANFSRDNRLVTTCWDGFIRLYELKSDGSLKLIAKQISPGGKQPFHAAFSSDGTKIAVGFGDSKNVDVLSGKDLSYLFSPSTIGVNNGNLGSVAWSDDGKRLFAGGTYYKGIYPILVWSDAGKGQFQELPGASSTIMHILPLKNGGIVFGAADPAFGVISASGERNFFKSAVIADFRANFEGFKLSQDGKTVQFGYEVWGKSPAVFGTDSGTLTPDGDASELFSPDISSLNITDWQNNLVPKLNGNALKLNPHEMSLSLAVSPFKNGFLLGTGWRLRLFNQNGTEQWNIPIPGAAWGVNIAQNGKLATAAFADGTIRWYQKDGKELLAFFPHKDRKRWVMWTPSGYYTASAGGEDMIGWHINNGKDAAADFFPVSKFRSRFYRPDITSKILDTLNEDEALRLANEESGKKQQETSLTQMLPPVVTIVSPSDGTDFDTNSVSVRFSVRSPSGEPITGIKALVDGRPDNTSRGITRKDVDKLTVAVPERDCEISVIAENRYAASEPATVRLRWKGKTTAPANATEEFVIKPKLYVLAVGVSKYQDSNLTLNYAAKDANDFAGAMEKQKGGLYREVSVKVLTDEKANKNEILDGLEWIQKETTAKDVAAIFFAGHGVNDSTGVYYFLPTDTDLEKLKRTGVVFTHIRNTVSAIAGKVLTFIDTCHSGNVMGTRRGMGPDVNAVINELTSAENGAVVFAASTGNQYSIEKAEWRNGAFTKALVEGIGGKAAQPGSSRITTNMLDLYLSERVKELTGGKQTPTTTKPHTVPDFPIAVK